MVVTVCGWAVKEVQFLCSPGGVMSFPRHAGQGHHWFRRLAGRLFKKNQPTLIFKPCHMHSDRKYERL